MFDIGRHKKFLGISIGERALLAAEVCCAENALCAARAAEFAYPPGASLERAEELGESLQQFLRQRGFSARRTVFGVPAKWLILRPHVVPPADEQTVAQMLRLHTDARIAPELGPMVFDYAGQCSSTQPTTVMLVGLQRQWIDRLEALARAAGLRAIGITSCGASLSAATAANVSDGLILLLRGEGVELITQDHAELRTVRHTGAFSPTRPPLAELRRAAASIGGGDDSPTDTKTDPRGNLVLWDDVGADADYVEAARQAAGLPLIRAQSQWVGVQSFDPPDGKGLSAVALTLAARNGSRLEPDFLHPRLAPPPVRSQRPRMAWIAAAAVLLLALGLVIDLAHLQRQISRPQSQLDALAPQLAVATPFVANMQFAEQFQTGRPRYVACLRDLTAAMPAEGQMYFRDFSLAMDMKGQVSGSTAADQNVINFVDKVNASGRFLDTNCRIYSSEAREGHGPGEVSFTLKFTYVPPD